MNEFAQYVNQMKLWKLTVPPGEKESDFVHCSFYLRSPEETQLPLSPEMFMSLPSGSGQIDNWVPEAITPVCPSQVRFGGHCIIAAVACPRGALRPDVLLGFPSSLSL